MFQLFFHNLLKHRTTKFWYVDATFRLVRAPFTQLFSTHTFVKSGENMKQIPLVFVVISGKAKADCGAVFRTVLYQLSNVPAVEIITADFEDATW